VDFAFRHAAIFASQGNMDPQTFIFSVAACLGLTVLWFGYLARVATRNSKDPLGGITLEKYDGVEFLDDVSSNYDENGLLESMDFVDTEGTQRSISDYEEKKNLPLLHAPDITSDFQRW
jgi:hypothetical protein